MSSDSRIVPGAPRWLVSLAYAALITAAVCWAAWPGQMTYDSLFAYQESLTGVETVLWPPLHAYLFWISRHLGAGAWGLFVAQTFVLFFAGAVALNLLVRGPLAAAAGLAAFAVAFVAAPGMLGTVLAHWRDGPTGGFALAGVAAWLMAARYRRSGLLALAAVFFGLAAGLRYNAVPLIVLVAPMMVWRPFLDRPAEPSARLTAAAGLVLALGLAAASTHWRLPDLKPMPNPHSFGGTQELDLLGISACADKVYLPPRLTAGWPITPAQIRQAYDPRHLQLALRPLPGAPRILESDAHGQVGKVWPRAVAAEPACYLAHRTAMLVEQMGLSRDGVFLVTAGGIAPNAFDLAHPRPHLVARVNAYLESRAGEPWRRPAILFLLAPLALVLLWLRREPAAGLLAALCVGAFAYVGLLFLAAPAADARYIFPPSLFCAFVISAAGAVLLSGRRGRIG